MQRSVEEIEREEVERIYQNIWINCHAGAFEKPLAMVTFDTAVNFGLGRFKEFFLEAAGYPLSQLDSVRAMTPDREQVVAIAICGFRIRHRARRVKQKPDQKVFLEGWINRDLELLDAVC